MLFLSAGEVSGDFYGAALLKQLSNYFPGPCYGLGGSSLRAAGQQQLADVLAYSAVGITENIEHLPRFRQLWERIKVWLRQCRPTLVVLIDFQGLNLRIGAYARRLGIPVFYFIAPQAWLWRSPGDLKRIARSCDLILSVFLPEHGFYQRQGIASVFVGHPLLDILPDIPKVRLGLASEQEPSFMPSICWLPGSRPIEVKRLAPILRNLIQYYCQHYSFQYRHVMPVATIGLQPLLTRLFSDLPVTLVSSSARYSAMIQSQQVIGASGSAILEAVLLEKPVVALYQVSALTYAIAQQVYPHSYITLPNLLLEQPLVPEFLQRFDTECIVKRLASLDPAAFKMAAAVLRRQLCVEDQSAVKKAAFEIDRYVKTNALNPR